MSISLDAQRDSILDQGVYREFILHLPEGYMVEGSYPIIMNFHGLGSNGFEQQLYSQFDDVADQHGFIVVYPDAINNSWDLFGNTDAVFISNLIDTLKERYAANDCLFFMGMSQGGFLSYKFGCESMNPDAIAIVTGGMTTPMQQFCQQPSELPVIHFHGTADEVVPYEGTFGIPPVAETVQYWAEINDCSPLQLVTIIQDVASSDSSTVEMYEYQECENESEAILYKIVNGGHTWPGAIHIPAFGNTNQDINASELIGEFFTQHCNSTTSLETQQFHPFHVYPNPADNFIFLETDQEITEALIYSVSGVLIQKQSVSNGKILFETSTLANGMYVVRILSEEWKAYHLILTVIH